MSEHEHSAKDDPGNQPTQDEVAKKADDLDVKEGRPQERADQNWSDAEAQLRKAGAGQAEHPEHQDAGRDEHKGHQGHRTTTPTWRRISASGSGFRWS